MDWVDDKLSEDTSQTKTHEVGSENQKDLEAKVKEVITIKDVQLVHCNERSSINSTTTDTVAQSRKQLFLVTPGPRVEVDLPFPNFKRLLWHHILEELTAWVEEKLNHGGSQTDGGSSVVEVFIDNTSNGDPDDTKEIHSPSLARDGGVVEGIGYSSHFRIWRPVGDKTSFCLDLQLPVKDFLEVQRFERRE